MADYSMNTGVPHDPRTLEDMGFQGMTKYETNPPTSKEPGVPYDKPPTPLVNEVNTSADSQKIDLGQTAHDITERTRNG